MKLKKVFIEALHNKNIIVSQNIDKFNQLISKNQDEFPDVNMNLNANGLNISSNLRKLNVVIDANRIVIDFNDPNNLEQCKIFIQSMLDQIAEMLDIEHYNRIGLRAFIGKELNTAQEIDECINRNFIKLSDSQINVLGENINNYHLGFTSCYDNYKANHNIGMLTGQEFNINFGKMDTKTRYFLLYDIDFYIDTLTVKKDVLNFLEAGCKKIKVCANEFFKIIEGGK